MLHPPPPEALLREAPQTRKRKRESAVTEIDELVSEDKDPPMLADSDKEATAESSKRSSEQPEPRPSDVLHDVMVVDGESEEGQVESILKMTQLSVDDNRARSQTRDHSVDLENGELQYPGSEEPMDVDVVPNSEADEGKTFPQTRAHAEPIVVEEDADMVSKDGISESVESDAKPETKHKQSAPLEENVAEELGSSVDDSSKYPE
ncbi:hypothetical protein BD309DRAFT_149109 [Dichomitus squalens]|nr:hypothetical protein BD309DRAFT_149109 [Dichomitus squalens]